MNSLRKMGIKSSLKLIPDFGLILPMKLFFVSCLKLFVPLKYINYLFECKHNIIESYLLKRVNPILSIKLPQFNNKMNSRNIWVFWWQGEKSMPKVVSRCYKQLLLLHPDCNIKLLTQENYRNYVNLDTCIIDKIGKSISITHLSDILRVNLLYTYGGVWVDATLYFIKPIPLEYFRTDFFSIKDHNSSCMSVARHRWTSFFLCSSKNSNFMKSLCDCFNRYFAYENSMIDYLLIDYFIDIIYNQNTEFRNLVDNMKFVDYDVHCKSILKQNFQKCIIEQIINNNLFIKLSYKELDEEVLLSYNSNYKYLVEKNDRSKYSDSINE